MIRRVEERVELRKKWLLAGALLASIGTGAVSAQAGAETGGLHVSFQLNHAKYLVGGTAAEAQASYLSQESTLIPASIVELALGAKLTTSNEAVKTLTVTYGDQSIQLQASVAQAQVNGEAVKLTAAPEVLKDGTWMVPVRFIFETFGAVVSYEASTETVRIDGPEIKEGFRFYRSTDFGYQIAVPQDWAVMSGPDYRLFVSEDGAVSLYFRKTSIAAQDTVEKWIARDIANMKQDFTQEALKSAEPVPVQLDGQNGYLWKYSYKLGSDWSHVYGVYVFKGGYKYEFALNFSGDQEQPALLDELLKGLKLTGEGEAKYGVMADRKDFVDRTKVHREQSSLGYALDIPDYWRKIEAKDGLSTVYNGNSAKVTVSVKEGKLEQALQDLKTNAAGLKDFQLVSEPVAAQLGGVNGYKLVYSGTEAGSGYAFQSTATLVEQNGKVIRFDSFVYKATDTEANRSMLKRVLESFELVK